MSIKDSINYYLEYHGESISKTIALKKVAEEFGVLEADFYIDCGIAQWGDHNQDLGPYIVLEPRHVPGVGFTFGPDGPGIADTDTTPTLGDAARVLMPKVGKFDKGFDEARNLIQLTATYKGVRIILQDTPPDTCHVEKVEEEVEVPEAHYPARKEKRVSYRLVGDCEPIMARTATEGE